jgi:hypothetical protein
MNQISIPFTNENNGRQIETFGNNSVKSKLNLVDYSKLKEDSQTSGANITMYTDTH